MVTTPLEELLRIGEFDEAVAIAQARVEIDANDVEARVALARVALGNEDIHEAQKQLSGLQNGVGGYEHELTRASLLSVTDQLDEAEKIYRTLAQEKPDRPEALIGLSLVAAEKGDVELELKALKKAALAGPDDAWIHYQLGMAFAQRGDAERASESLIRSMELNPQDDRPLLALASGLIEAGELDAAEDMLREYGENVEENPQTIALLVQVLVCKGELDEARNLAVMNADENELQPGLQTEAARLLLTSGDIAQQKEAISRCETLIQAGTALPLTHVVRAQAAELMDDYKTAAKHYELALEFEEAHDDAAILTNFGLLHLEHGDAKKATEPLERALEISPDSPQALFNVALLRAKLGDKEKAKALLMKSDKLCTDDFKIEVQRLLASLEK